MSATRQQGDSTVRDLDELYTKAKSARAPFDPAMLANVAHFQGNQWHYVVRGRLYRPDLEDWRVLFTDNRIIGIVRTEVAKLTKSRPVFVATPTTGADSDVASAELTERVLTYLWRELGLQRKLRAVLHWSRVCGAGFWKITWDSTKGETASVLVGPDGQPFLDQNQRPMRPDNMPDDFLAQLKDQGIQARDVSAGECAVTVKSPFETFVDPLADEEGLDSAEWLIDEAVRSADYVKRRFNVDLEPDTDAIAGIAESRMAGINPGQGSYKGVRIRELWAKPSSKFPNGRKVVWVKGKVLEEDRNPYDCLPYVMFSGIPVPGRFWPTCLVDQLRGPQTEFNKTRSQIRENAARIGNPAVLLSRMANVSMKGVPGEKIWFDDTMQNPVPRYLQPPEMPGYVINELGQMMSSFQEISGQHEVSQAQVPTGVTAAAAIQLLQEQDDTRLGPDVADMEAAIGDAGRKLARLVARFYTDQRTIQLAGDDGDWDFREFRGAMLGENIHVDVQEGSAFPKSLAGKQAAMQEALTAMLQNQAFLDHQSLARFLKAMPVGGFEAFTEYFSATQGQINRENRRLSQGEPLPVNEYDDDQAHIDGHEEHQRTPRYELTTVLGKRAFEQHIALHKQRVANQQIAQQQSQVAQQGAQAQAQAVPQQQMQLQDLLAQAQQQQAAPAANGSSTTQGGPRG